MRGNGYALPSVASQRRSKAEWGAAPQRRIAAATRLAQINLAMIRSIAHFPLAPSATTTTMAAEADMNTDTLPKWINLPTLIKRLAACDASFRELADIAGVEPSTILRLQRGDFSNPKQETLRKVDRAISAWNRKRRAKALEDAMPATVGRRID